MTPDEYRAAPWPHRMYSITVAEAKRMPSIEWEAVKKTVHGYVCPPFASRKADGGGWSLDHLPTGYKVPGRCDRLRDAKDAARALVEYTDGTDAWEFDDPDDMPPEAKDAFPAVRRAF